MKTILIIILLLIVVVTVIFVFESRRFKQWLEKGHLRIKKAKASNTRVRTQDLPPQLQRYLEKIIIQEATSSYVMFTQSGDFRMKPEDKMSSFTAEQFASVVSPMFSWVATIRLKGLTVTVCDRLVDGEGELQARLFSSIPLAKGSGDRFLRGELLRYLAELPWYPMAILHQPDIQWKSSAENKITATIALSNTSATVEYTLNNEGLIESIFVPDREKADGTSVELKPWLGEFSQYEERKGVLIPIEGQVSWLLESGKFTYFKGRITNY